MPTYRFGEFELDVASRQLRLNGEPVHLERRPFNFLVRLVSEPGRLHSREELIAALWPSQVVIDFDTGLNTLVRKVRQALGDSPDDQRFVATVAREGYRFVAPVTVVHAQAHDPEQSAPAPATKRVDRRQAMVAAVVLLVLAAALGTWRMFDGDPSQRIAVLPFENLTGKPELDYLAIGLAQETSLSLSRIDLPQLSVVGIVSARAMTESSMPLADIARQAGVDYVVDSSLRQEGARIRVNSSLLRIRDGEQVWTASFDRQLTNVLGLQRELSIAIAEQIRQKLSPDVAERIDRRQTQNPAAYALYLKGREHWTRFHPTSVDDALNYYDRAVVVDPEYGLAWAGIAHAATTAGLTSDARPDIALHRAQTALEQAHRFGEDLAETWVAQGAYSNFVEWDYVAAESATRRAIELDPNNAMAHMTLAMSLAAQERHVESRVAMRRARELDPLFPLIFANSGYIERAAGNPELSIEFTRQAIAMDPDFWVGYYQLGFTLFERQDYAGALRAYEAADRLSGRKANVVANRAYMLACLGRDDEARALRDLLLERAVERYVPPASIAYIEAGLGNLESAVEWLQRAVDTRDIHLPTPFKRDPEEVSIDSSRVPWLQGRCSP